MSLPDGFLDELRTRLSIAQVVGRKVIWDPRKSNQGKGDMWAPCPFHQEKSASFHVDDQKGYYYCFGCHAKGDAISFVRETENVGFMEAVQILAGEAGMPMPQRDPEAQKKADRRTQLADVMEQAVQFFRLSLKTGPASEARDYLVRRGFNDTSLERWEIGFAPDGWQNLWDHLTAKDVSPDMMMDCGLAKPSSKGGKPYDTFRNRIMFPIRDGRGRAIAFGGRAMDPNDNAKYLNSPETVLFDKGRNLYNQKPAREAAGKGGDLIVAEGYMDVIALSEAGFGATVAPLGTAITEDQLRLMWRIAREPIIALDGDTAGMRAAMRVIDTALPMLEAGQSVRFALMPEGMDPDDLVKGQGPGAMQALLDQAIPMVQLLWRRETEGKVFDSPERKAALDKALRAKIQEIKDPSIRSHYGEEIKSLRWELFRQNRGGTAKSTYQPRGKWQPQGVPMASTKASVLGAGAAAEDHLRESVILATLISNPAILGQFESALERMICASSEHEAIRHALLRHVGDQPEVLRGNLVDELGLDTLEKLMSQSHVAITPAVRRAGDTEIAAACVAEELDKLGAKRRHAREIADAVEDLSGIADEGVTWRLSQAANAINGTGRGAQEDKTEFETGENGAKMKKDERSKFDALLDQIGFGKGDA
jgi:DNA primase